MAYFRCTGNSGGSLKLRTAQGEIASFETNLPEPYQSVTVNVVAKQDLHGYDHPWAEGGGVNILKPIATDTTVNGVRVVGDDSGKVTVTGTASADTPIEFYSFAVTSLDNYTLILKEDLSGSNDTYWLSMSGVGVITSGHRATFSFTGTGTFKIRLNVKSGSATNFTVYPMVAKGNVDIPYAPYSNICPINGYSSANITRCGVNLWDEEWELGGISTVTGIDFPNNNQIRSVNYIKVFPNTTYYNKGYTLAIIGYDENKNFVEFLGNITVGTFTIPSGVSYIRFCRTSTTYNNDISINYPSSDTDYHAFNGQTYTIAFGQTVYGGVLDVTRGKLHVTHKEVDLGDYGWVNENDTQTGLCRASAQFTDCVWQSVMICSAYKYNSTTSYNGLSDGDIALTNSESIPLLRVRNTAYSTYTNAQIKEAVTGMKLVYQTKTPFDIDLTPVQIRALVGENNVFADCGETEVEYLYLK